jgi:hypothetical protein
MELAGPRPPVAGYEHRHLEPRKESLTMLPSYIKTAKDWCALIESAGFGDTSFYGRWLLAAAAAETHWKTIRNEEEFFGLTWGAIPDLGVGALHMLAGLGSNYCVVSLRPEEMVDWPIICWNLSSARAGPPYSDR